MKKAPKPHRIVSCLRAFVRLDGPVIRPVPNTPVLARLSKHDLPPYVPSSNGGVATRLS